jgi:hypothetical protein
LSLVLAEVSAAPRRPFISGRQQVRILVTDAHAENAVSVDHAMTLSCVATARFALIRQASHHVAAIPKAAA